MDHSDALAPDSMVDSQITDGGADTSISQDGTMDAQEPPVEHSFDVVVVGAGTGGFGAALQAARMGASVALVEETDWVGGQANAAGVTSMDGPEHWGLYDEFIERIRSYYQARGKSISTCYWSTRTECFEPHVGRAIMLDMLSEEPNITLFLRFVPLSAETRTVSGRPRLETVTFRDEADGKEHRFSAHVFIDATEYGDILPLAHARYRVGNSVSPNVDLATCVQDITYTAVIRRYSTGVPPGLSVSEAPPGYGPQVEANFSTVVTRDGTDWVDAQGHWTSWGGHYPTGWRTFVNYRGMPDSATSGDASSGSPDGITRTGINWPNDFSYTVAAIEDREARRTANCAAKLRTIRFLYYMASVLGKTDWGVADDEGYDGPYNQSNHCPDVPPELEQLERNMPPIPYVRESRRVVGLHTLTASEIRRDPAAPGGTRSETAFPTALAVGVYAVDLHGCMSDENLELDLESLEDVPDRPLSGPFQIPYESFIPEEVDGLLPAEKNLSVSRLVNGAIRLQPITMLTGQAAGAIAALAVSRNCQPREVPPIRVQDALVRAGVRLSLVRYRDVPPDHPHWAAVQIAAVRRIMVGNDADTFFVDEPLTRAQAAAVFCALFNLDTSNPPANPSFSDVPTDNPYYAYVETLHGLGFVAGCAQDPPRYCPDDPLTRAQAATILVRALGLDPNVYPTNPIFSDVPPTHWAFPYVQLAAEEGLMEGCSGQDFCPDSPMARWDMAETSWTTLLYMFP